MVYSKVKIICLKCNKVKRIKCFVYNKKESISMCRQCSKKIGSNIFYIPSSNKPEGNINKFSLSGQEVNVLYRQLESQGLNPEQIWRRINYTKWNLRRNKARKKGLDTIKQNRELKAKQNKEENKKELLEGLKA